VFDVAKIKGLILPQGMVIPQVMIQYKGEGEPEFRGFTLRTRGKAVIFPASLHTF